MIAASFVGACPTDTGPGPTPFPVDDDATTPPTQSMEESTDPTPTPSVSSSEDPSPTPTAPPAPMCGPFPFPFVTADETIRTGYADMDINDFGNNDGSWTGCEIMWFFSGGALDCFIEYHVAGPFGAGSEPPPAYMAQFTVNRFVLNDTCGMAITENGIQYRVDYVSGAPDISIARREGLGWAYVDENAVGSLTASGGSISYVEIVE